MTDAPDDWVSSQLVEPDSCVREELRVSGGSPSNYTDALGESDDYRLLPVVEITDHGEGLDSLEAELSELRGELDELRCALGSE